METYFFLEKFIFNLDQWLNLGNLLIGLIGLGITIYIACIANKLSVREKYKHEIDISEQLKEFIGKKVILTDVKKYNFKNIDTTNITYFKLAAELENIIPVYGIEVVLRDSKDFKLGLIPFDWIEYVRPYDSEDSSIIIICKFKGIKWFKNLKSPIFKINGIKKI